MSLSFDFGGVDENISCQTKFRLGGERFAIKDDRGEIAYQVEGSFFLRFLKPLPSMMRLVNKSVRLVKKS